MTLQRKVAALLMGAATLVATASYAQIGAAPVITVPGSVTSDAPVETSLNTVTAGGQYAPNTQFIASLDQALFNNGVNAQNAGTLLPVTQPLPCDSYDPMIDTIAPAVANTYYGALNVVQSQATELEGEDFTSIAANVQAPAELASTQGVGQGTLSIVQELELLRQSVNTLVQVVATAELQKLDANIRSKMPRDESNCPPVDQTASAVDLMSFFPGVP